MDNENLKKLFDKRKHGDPISFHMPGHKGRSDLFEDFGYGELFRNVTEIDITEIPGADNLHRPTGAIRRMEEGYAEVYGVQCSRLLVNGGSAGVMAAVLAAVPRGGQLLMARNSHVSAYNAIRLGGITPRYVMPGEDGRIAAEDVRAMLERYGDVSAVMITSPTYHGVISDVAAISEAAHSYGIPLIVDQAHGAHLVLLDKHQSLWGNKGHSYNSKDTAADNSPLSAERSDADLIVDSTHKMLMSFTGSGILNVNSKFVSEASVTEWLSALQTTSPSYIALASLEANLEIMKNGSERLVSDWLSGIEFFRYNVKRMENYRVAKGEHLDPAKLYIVHNAGLGGGELAEGLIHRNIWPEMWDANGVLLMTGPGNVRRDYEELLRALYQIDQDFMRRSRNSEECRAVTSDDTMYSNNEPIHRKPSAEFLQSEMPEFVGIPVHSESVPLYEAEGRTAAEQIIPYPPGIPVICPGERYSYEVIRYLGELLANGVTVLGTDSEGMVKVGE